MSKTAMKSRVTTERQGHRASLHELQIELVKVQRHTIKHGHRVLVIFDEIAAITPGFIGEMDETLGNLWYEDQLSPFLGGSPGAPQAAPRCSEDTAHKIDQAVCGLIQRAFDRASTILKQRRDVLELAAALLLEHEALDKNEFEPFAKRLEERTEAA